MAICTARGAGSGGAPAPGLTVARRSSVKRSWRRNTRSSRSGSEVPAPGPDCSRAIASSSVRCVLRVVSSSRAMRVAGVSARAAAACARRSPSSRDCWRIWVASVFCSAMRGLSTRWSAAATSAMAMDTNRMARSRSVSASMRAAWRSSAGGSFIMVRPHGGRRRGRTRPRCPPWARCPRRPRCARPGLQRRVVASALAARGAVPRAAA